MLDRISEFIGIIVQGQDTDVIIIKLLNILLIGLLVNRLLSFALKSQGRTLSTTLRYLAYAFIALGGAIMIDVLAPLGIIRWNLLLAFAQTVFIAASFFAVSNLKDSIDAYAHLLKK